MPGEFTDWFDKNYKRISEGTWDVKYKRAKQKQKDRAKQKQEERAGRTSGV
jgi:hypothetical protein